MLIERIAYNQFNEFVTKNGILKSHQSGFRGSHSCESAINDVLCELKEALNESKSVIAIFLDLQRAFETVDPEILVEKLAALGVDGTALAWFACYLIGRKQRVKMGETMSNELSIDFGVPQGSILGPLLFVLYVNDIGNGLKQSQIKMFADDTLVYVISDNIVDSCNELNEDLEVLLNDLCQHKLKLNVSETKAILISNKKSVDVSALNLKINDEDVLFVDQVKYLGIVIDNKIIIVG